MVRMKRQEIVLLVTGIILFGIGIYIRIHELSWISSVSGPSGGLIGAGVVLTLITLKNYLNEKKGIITEDERDYRIAEKASLKAYQTLLILQGILFFILSMFNMQIQAQPVVGILFAFTAISYIAFFYWYRKEM
jgi:uncharacterized membrane protein